MQDLLVVALSVLALATNFKITSETNMNTTFFTPFKLTSLSIISNINGKISSGFISNTWQVNIPFISHGYFLVGIKINVNMAYITWTSERGVDNQLLFCWECYITRTLISCFEGDLANTSTGSNNISGFKLSKSVIRLRNKVMAISGSYNMRCCIVIVKTFNDIWCYIANKFTVICWYITGCYR